MIKDIGICTIINWDYVIKDLENNIPEYVGPSHKRGDNLPGLDPIIDMWDRAGYKTVHEGGTAGWDMFIPGKQFDQQIVDLWNEFYDLNCKNVWISRVWPGRFAPIHWDVHDNEDKLPECPRYHSHIGKPQWGHIFIVDNKCLYNQPQGITYKWVNRKLWHAGTNCGITPKYIWNAW
jgi:hypothetical protein